MNRFRLFLGSRKLVIIILFITVFSGFSVFWYLNNQKQKSYENTGQVEIYTAGQDIFKGDEIDENMIEAKRISREVFNEEFLTDIKDIVGMKTTSDIAKGEIIRSGKLEGMALEENTYLKFSSYIPEGLRAVSIPVNYYGEHALLSKGDKVDIISTYYDSKNEELVSETVLKHKDIIFISGRSQVDSEDTVMPGYSPSNNTGNLVFGSLFDSSISDGSGSSLIILTFYLDQEEVESIMLSLQLGALNLAICPG